MSDDDALMRGFLYMKAILARYGRHDAADLLALADRLVERGEFAHRRLAIEAIERQMDVPLTTPLSAEGASHATRSGGRPT